jgi:hypothetical protein
MRQEMQDIKHCERLTSGLSLLRQVVQEEVYQHRVDARGFRVLPQNLATDELDSPCAGLVLGR